jgi:hypothetical protein
MDRNETRLHERPVEPPAGDQSAQAAASGASAAAAGATGPATQAPARPAAAPPQARSAPSQPIGEFRPPSHRSQRGLASRSWVPVALSFGTALLVAIALVIYFSQHT